MMSDTHVVEGYLRPMIEGDLERVLVWRNNPEIRRYMFTQHEITFTEHSNWFKCASGDATKRLLIFMQNNIACGFVNFSNVNHGSVADWGFYKAPDAPKGTGRKLGRAALKFAFDEIGLHKVCGQALDFNAPSIKFHRMLGFRQEGVLRDQHYDGDSYYAVICFGLLRQEWSQDFSK